MKARLQLTTFLGLSLLPVTLAFLSPNLVTRNTPSCTITTNRDSSAGALNVAFLPDHIDLDLAVASSNALQSYSHLLLEHPLTTKTVTAAVLAFGGDAIAQVRSSTDDHENNYDIMRGFRFLCFGALYTGAFQHFWFDLMGQNIENWGEAFHLWGPQRADLPVDVWYSRREWWSYFDVLSGLEHPPLPAVLAAAKVAVNQFLVIPFVYMPLFFWITSQFDVEAAKERAEELYFPLLKRNYFYWLPMQFVQFFVLPPEWQIPFVSAASLVWTIVLSSIAAQQTNPNEPAAIETTAMDITEEVSLSDVREAVLPESVNQLLEDERTGAAATGVAVGLLASAAGDAALADVVGGLVDTEVGATVALLSAIGAGTGFVAASSSSQHSSSDSCIMEDDKASDNEVTKYSKTNVA